MQVLAPTPALIDKAPHCDEFPSSELLFCISLGQGALHLIIIRFCDLDGHVERQNADLNCLHQALLSLAKQSADHSDVILSNADLLRDIAIGVTSFPKRVDIFQKI